MSKTIDERVVAMKFKKDDFENGVKSTLSALENLKRGLKLDGAARGLQDVNAAAKGFSLGNMASAVEGMAQKFSTLGILGVSALATIASKATMTGMQVAKSLTIAPIMQGMQEYETNLNSIQTILANTQASGATLNDVNGALQKLNTYSDQTIYNFSQMARNIGTFTAAGVDLKTSTDSIKGIANLAALSGSNSEQASTAMYQLSQAIAAGKVGLQDWNSVVNAGMGGTIFQRALAQTAVTMGKLPESAVKLTGKMKNVTIAGEAFRESISAKPGKNSWLSADVLTTTLKQFTGDMTDAQLKAQGFNKAQIKAIQLQAKTAKAAATEVKTFSGLMDTTKEAIGSGWAQTWQNIAGDFKEAKRLWTGVSGAIGVFVTANANARNKVLADWKRLHGRAYLMTGIKMIFTDVVAVIKTVKDAFQEIFPPATGADLARLSSNFMNFAKGLKMGAETAKNLKTTFKGVFAVFSIAAQIIKGVVSGFFRLIGMFKGGEGGVLSFTASLATFLIKIDEWLKKGQFIQKFFDMLANAGQAVIPPLVQFVTGLVKAFSKLIQGDVPGFVDQIQLSFTFLKPIVDKVRQGIDLLMGVVDALTGRFQNFRNEASAGVQDALVTIADLIDRIKAKFESIKGSIKLPSFNFGGGGGGDKATSMFASMKSAGISAADGVGAAWDKLMSIFQGIADFFAPMLNTVQQLFITIGDKLKTWIAGMDMTDAVAVINTGFFIALYIAARKFIEKMNGILDSFSGIGTHIHDTLDKVTETLEMMQKNVKSTIILKIAIALGILAAALYLLSTIDPKRLASALAGMGALLLMLTMSMKSFLKVMETVEGSSTTPASMGKIIAMGVTLVLLAIAVSILATAVKKLSDISWPDMIKGLIGVGVLLAGLMLFTKFSEMDQGSLKAGVNLLLLAVAIRLLVNSVALLGAMDPEALKQGAGAIAYLLTMMTAAAIAFTQYGNKGVPGIVAMAGALAILTPVIMALGMVPFENLAKGLGAIAVALGLMAGTAVIMSKWGNKGAPGVLAMAGALAILTPAIIALGMVPYENLAKGLGTIAIALGLLVGASILMGQPETILGAAAMILIAAALGALVPVILLLGQADVKTLAKGLGALAVALVLILAAGLAAMYVGPGLMILGQAIALLGAAAMMAGIGMVLFGTGFAILAATGTAGVAVMVAAFMAFLNLLPLIAQQIGLAVIAFAVVISTAGPKITAAMATVLNSLLDAVIKVLPKLEILITKLIEAILRILVNAVPKMVTAGWKILTGILDGIAKNIGKVAEKAVDIVVNFLDALTKARDRLIQAGVDYIINFVEGLANGIRDNSERMGAAGGDLGAAIIEGMASGLSAGVGRVKDAAVEVAKKAFEGAKEFLKVNSPSKKFMMLGDSADEGFAKGFDRSTGMVVDSAEGVGQAAIDSMRKTIANVADLIGSDMDMNPTITPVLDLSGVKRDAGQIGSLLSPNRIAVGSAYTQANDISAGYNDNKLALAENLQPIIIEKKVEYNQTNNSPKALSPATIYRQTKSQLASAKGAVSNA